MSKGRTLCVEMPRDGFSIASTLTSGVDTDDKPTKASINSLGLIDVNERDPRKMVVSETIVTAAPSDIVFDDSHE